MRYLSIDYGAKATGLAVCDPTETIVSPLAVLRTAKDLIGKILEFTRRENIEAIVLGLPLNMDGSSGGQADIIRAFADELKKHIAIPIFFQDERLTTFAAEEKLAHHPCGGLAPRKLTRKKKKSRIDAIAAAEILQQFLDSKQSK
ncbi:MAG: Holliday junction resolvase RuvX [Sedimentisphaerales bacterium]|nr:Holliday junction resolvase RuvX [Sedimentisphaerales bacterium]